MSQKRVAQQVTKTLPSALGVVGLTVALWVFCATLVGDGSSTAWVASTVATLAMGLALAASLCVTLAMTRNGLGIAGVFAGIITRLFPAVGLLLWSQSQACPLKESALAQMIVLNYLVGLIVETYAAYRLVGQVVNQPPPA